MRAIDVSDFSGKITEEQFRLVKEKHQIEGVIIQLHGGRAVGGVGINRFVSLQRENALRAGLWVAGYIWPPMAATRADVVTLMKQGWKFIALDVEGRKEHVVTREYINAVADTGNVPVIYTSRTQWHTIMNDSRQYKDIPLWEARYKYAPNWPRDDEVNVWDSGVSPCWDSRIAWQFYGTSVLGGIKCDLNVVDRFWLEGLKSEEKS